ncbi:disease resistance protein RPV1 [Eucalyptus grandis]|uniref:disease resistance protein RPV1 n=1 Tax=Eucalyptus grandis TaxID=71139 RepID=UPI00192E867F|nr:disease resistance protein RPV1 [Eucalyptus grandis]
MERKRSSSLETGSTSHGSSGIQYDVFLSFRGPDTRTTFTDYLYHTLLDKGISVFIDKQGIDVGGEIGPKIYQAINDSKICIPIFSSNYASSSWCLRELEHMMQRWKTNELEVMPIFYDVEPSDVKLETGVYVDALTLHKEKHGPEIVQCWAESLKEVTGIKGWDTKNTGHGELAHLIARKVLVKLKVSCVHISDHLVGMDESANEVVDLLNVTSEDVRLIGMWGMGGIGKTTLAKVVYNKLSTNFDSCSFISDIREASQGSGLLNMQRQLLSDIIGNVVVEPSSIDHGKNMIKNRFCRKKVLIFLDDVDHEHQLMALVAKEEWFGSGSRIVVTTRDRSVFCKLQYQFEHCLIYEVKELNNLTALQLFSKHAFRSNSPPNAFLSLSKKVIAKTGGLPLAIEVIGSLLCGKKEERVWQDTLKKMEYCQQRDVKEKLMLSYQALDHLQQQIFLDIACFLAGQDKSYPCYMWDGCGFFPSEGIDVLLLMSLVKIREWNELWMHDQLKDLGKSIVYEENCKDPTKGSRVWRDWQGGSNIVQQKKGTETVAAYYDQSKEPLQDSVLTSKDFIKVPNIRFLSLSGWTLSGDFGDLFSELRWLTWGDCPKEIQATNFCPKNLVILDLYQSSSIDEHWGGWTQLKVATRLKVLNLLPCRMLKQTDKLFAFLSLEKLILKGCKMLKKLSDLFVMLKYLVELEVFCTSIVELPNNIVNLKSLKVLKINDSCMQKLPDAIGIIEKLEEI